jgi:hypothetical protein
MEASFGFRVLRVSKLEMSQISLASHRNTIESREEGKRKIVDLYMLLRNFCTAGVKNAFKL